MDFGNRHNLNLSIAQGIEAVRPFLAGRLCAQGREVALRDTLVRQGLLHLLGNQAQVAALVPLIDESAGLQPVKDAQVFLHIVLLLRLQSRVGCCGRLPVDEYRVPGDGHLRTGAHHRGDAVISHPGAVGGADHHRRLVAAGN
ncbi:Head decoration protein, partial [Dysosmobacter welbionis]